jgi:acyl-CoA synthetase (AMP-forming)/AMP-acid ligase II
MDRNDYLVAPPAACDASVLAGLSARDILAATVARTPAGLAYVDGPLRLTWGDAAACVAALADELERAGIGAGDVVGLRLPNGAAFAIAHLAIAELGAVTLPLHVPYGDAEVREFLAATSARAYVHTGCTGDCRDLREAVPSLTVLVHCATERAAFSVEGTASPARRRPARIEPHAPFCIMPTSGTESPAPKLCLHTHDGLLSNARAFVAEAEIGPLDGLIVAGGFTHLFGLLGLHVSLIAGATLLALPRFDAHRFLALAATEHATRAWAVPAQLIDLVEAARTRPYRLTLREVRTAGAPAGAALIAGVRAALGADVTVHWGMSELGGGITTYGRDAGVHDAAIGLPIAGAEVRIARPDGSEAEPGEVGALLYRRADLFRGYLNDPDATARAFAPGGWLRTGDRASRDAAGVVHYHGREKDIINRGGYKIGSAEIEAHLQALPAVRRVAVVAVPDPRLGERACVVAELHPGASLTLPEVADLLASRGVAKYKWPEHLAIVELMPMTATNKIAKSAVRELARRLTMPAVTA